MKHGDVHIAAQYFLNHRLEEIELRRQVRELAAAGFECIYDHARNGLVTPYFSRDWWHAVDVIVDECRKNHVRFAIWDEDGYPSPTAGDRVVQNHPEFAGCSLDFVRASVRAGEHGEVTLPAEELLFRAYAVYADGSIEDISDCGGTVLVKPLRRWEQTSGYTPLEKIAAPHWRSCWADRHYVIGFTPQRDAELVAVGFKRRPGMVDILNADAIRYFLEITHEVYLKRYGQHDFDELFDASFMDEPSPAAFYPWTPKFPAEFERRFGYDLVALLPHLVMDIDDRSRVIRHHYRMTQGDLQRVNYLETVRTWDREHHINSCGHLSRTEYLSFCNAILWPNELRCCSGLEIPCTDPLGYYIAYPDSCAYHTAIKVVSSAAHIYKRRRAGSDALAVMGNSTALRDLKFQLDFQMTLGLTYFNVHGLSYSTDGLRKDEVPPPLFYQNSEFPEFGALLRETRRRCERLERGEHLCEIALLYPTSAFDAKREFSCDPLESAYHRLAERLLSNQKDFDFVDEEFLAGTGVQDFLAKYHYMIVPELDCIEERTARKLEQFAALGGHLLLLGKAPALLGDRREAPAPDWARFVCADPVAVLPGPVVTGEGRNDVFLQRRIEAGRIDTFVFNRGVVPFRGSVDGVPCFVGPRSAEFLDEAVDPAAGYEACEASILAGKVDFHSNMLPLCGWYTNAQGNLHADLMARQTVASAAPGERLRSRFLYCGEPAPLRLVMDTEHFDHPVAFRCFLNGVEIGPFRNERVIDCMNRTAELTHALRGGSTPQLNVLEIEPAEPATMNEMPFFAGDFRAEFPNGSTAFPLLSAAPNRVEFSAPQSWTTWGRPGYSGDGEYTLTVEIPAPGAYKLDLGRVEDLVVFNGKTLIAPPYVLDLGEQSAGALTLHFTVANHSGNRDRLSGHPAGWLGPARLLKKSSR